MWRFIFKGFLSGMIILFLGSFQGAAQELPRGKFTGNNGTNSNGPAVFAGTVSSVPSGPVQLVVDNAGPYKMIERSDWSRYDNGKYVGHVYREVRASIVPEPVNNADSFLYRGNFFVLEETLRDMRQSARSVDEIIPVKFQIFRNGKLAIDDDQGFPAFRGFPAFPTAAVRPGSKWTAQGSRAVDPLNTGQLVVVPLVVEYEYRGTELYRDIPVYRVFAKYASRYGNTGISRSSGGEPRPSSSAVSSRGQSSGYFEGQSFVSLQGTHNVDILIQIANGLPLLMRDNMDEIFTWSDGSTVRFRGFTLIFNEGTMPLNRGTIIASLGNTLGIKTTPSTDVVPASSDSVAKNIPGGTDSANSTNGDRARIEDVLDGIDKDGGDRAVFGGSGIGMDLVSIPEGIRLIVKDIRFIPDSDEFLPEERSRLDIIAQALKSVPERNFLVEGHTAALGRPSGEMDLSIRRAKRMVDELTHRGISEDRFIYKGWGGIKPIGDNSNEAGRSRNRRVEITILE
jgi:outer membrane protein OmpA-like peptidoglycan-associated protein